MPIEINYYYPNVYSRHGDDNISDKHRELYNQVEKLTGDSPIKKGIWNIVGNHKEHEEHQCFCSCYKLLINYIVEHVPSGKLFSVGSECISQFEDEILDDLLNYYKRGAPVCCCGKKISDGRTKNGRNKWCDDSKCECRPCITCSFTKLGCICKKCIDCPDKFFTLDSWRIRCKKCWVKKQNPVIINKKKCLIEDD